MVEAAPRLAADGGVDLTHQTGERDVELVRNAYRDAGLPARVEPFLYAMDREMTQADVLVCRAPARRRSRRWRRSGVAAILIPLPTATDDHQKKNAEVLARAGAAEMVEQKDMAGGVLAARLLALVHDGADRRPQLRRDRGAAPSPRPDAARVIVDRALELAQC